MARYELLNNVAHQDLRVILRFGPEFGDATGVVQAFPTEYAELQREYPILLRKDPDGGGFQSVALLGFEQQENLFLQDAHWNAAYLPGIVAKGPFLIGFQEQHEDGVLRREPVIHVDLDHPRVSFDEGERVFLPQGGNSPYLEHIITVLRGIRDGVEGGDAMFAAFDALGLIQPLRIDVQLGQEHNVHLAGLYGIDRERLAALDAASLHGLHRAGYLEGVYLLLASLHNMRRLMAEKQRRLQHVGVDAVASGQAA
ncbi:SapC family protein [Xanthomonas sp. CFBP 8703]|uniref:SapC family protein n=1 Tax=Xanthomonas bonasiae TaxID=2810351 RepID=A0ABS3B294_9XANT|nr:MULTISPECIES: SapC family protein [Xanthomonas]MBD7923801.1 SapC family protein [Xanthomonas surreyensis]MBN6102740.1 SapC family protein [Xanthomonas bonasiae]